MIQRGFVPPLDIGIKAMGVLPPADIDAPQPRAVRIGNTAIQLCVNSHLPSGVLVCGSIVLTGMGTGKFDSLT